MENKTCQCLNLPLMFENCVFQQVVIFDLCKCHCCVIVIYFVSLCEMLVAVGPLIALPYRFRRLIMGRAFCVDHVAMCVTHVHGLLVFSMIQVFKIYFYTRSKLPNICTHKVLLSDGAVIHTRPLIVNTVEFIFSQNTSFTQ